MKTTVRLPSTFAAGSRSLSALILLALPGFALAQGGAVGSGAPGEGKGVVSDGGSPRAGISGPPGAVGAEAPKQREVPHSLEEMLALALRSNPDVLVAEAKVRQAQAELNQVRLKVAQEVAILRAEKEKREIAVQGAEEALGIARKLVETGRSEASELAKATLALALAKASLAAWDAEARYLLGLGGGIPNAAPAPGVASPPGGSAPPGGFQGATSEGAAWLAPRTRPEIPEKFQKLLETTQVAMQFEATPLSDVLSQLHEILSIPFVLDNSLDAEEISVKLSFQAHLKAIDALAALQDSLRQEGDEGIVFVFRDYGIFVTTGFVARFLPGATIPPEIPYEPER